MLPPLWTWTFLVICGFNVNRLQLELVSCDGFISSRFSRFAPSLSDCVSLHIIVAICVLPRYIWLNIIFLKQLMRSHACLISIPQSSQVSSCCHWFASFRIIADAIEYFVAWLQGLWFFVPSTLFNHVAYMNRWLLVLRPWLLWVETTVFVIDQAIWFIEG